MNREEIENQQASLYNDLQQLEKLKTQTEVDNNVFSYYTDQDNLIKWQLEVNDILDTLYHLLRGDRITIKNGNRIWEPIDSKNMPISEEGVQEILREVYIYINKNLLLSYYDDKQIPERLYKFADEFADLVMDKFDTIGMDTYEKQEKYTLIVLGTVNSVESAYRRAMGGKERDSLTKKTMVHQSLNPMGGGMGGGMRPQQGSKKSWYNPLSWFKG